MIGRVVSHYEIAFAWNGEGQDNFDIYRKLIGAGEPLRLTRDPADDESPAWSPDGRFIAFLRDYWQGSAPGVAGRGVYFTTGSHFLEDLSLEFLDLSTLEVRQLLRASRPPGLGLAISPDGRWLLYSQTDAFDADLILVENVR